MQIAEELLLPCQPRALALLMRELLSDTPHLRRLDQLFSSDPVLAGWLLECANSAPYQMQSQVRGIPQALTLLGVRQLRLILKKAQSSVAVRPPAGMDMGQFWEASLASAKLARSIAGLARLDSSTAYLGGLLHALGQLVLHLTQAERLQRCQMEVGLWDPRRSRVEAHHWGYSANQITAALLRQWSLPADVVYAIQNMERPLEMERFEPLAGVLHLAAWCTRATCSGWNERQMADAFPVDVALALGVDVDAVLQQEAPDWHQIQI